MSRYRLYATSLLIMIFPVFAVCKATETPVAACVPEECPPIAQTVVDSFPQPLIDGEGLYGAGSNVPPADHSAAGLRAALDVPASGAVLATIGMSNTELEFEAFRKLAASVTDADVVETACWGCVVGAWDTPSGRGWTKANNWLARNGYAPGDVDVVWLKVTRAKDRAVSVDDLERILGAMRTQWPNVRQVFVSDRIYTGYIGPGTEPLGGWNAGLAVREFVSRHWGETRPWIAWGPYLWAYGERARSDQLAWLASDFQPDMVHPSEAGAVKVGQMLLKFFSTAPETVWFRQGSS